MLLYGRDAYFLVEKSVYFLNRYLYVKKAFLPSCDEMETQDRYSVQFACNGVREFID